MGKYFFNFILIWVYNNSRMKDAQNKWVDYHTTDILYGKEAQILKDFLKCTSFGYITDSLDAEFLMSSRRYITLSSHFIMFCETIF